MYRTALAAALLLGASAMAASAQDFDRDNGQQTNTYQAYGSPRPLLGQAQNQTAQNDPYDRDRAQDRDNDRDRADNDRDDHLGNAYGFRRNEQARADSDRDDAGDFDRDNDRDNDRADNDRPHADQDRVRDKDSDDRDDDRDNDDLARFQQ